MSSLEDIPGVGRITAKKLLDAGIGSVSQLALYTVEELVELTGLDEARARKILYYARRLARRVEDEVYTAKGLKSLEKVLLTTGVKTIDKLLGGGLEPVSIYEFAGEFGSGKTQLCHQLSVTVQLSRNRGGVGGKAFYIDTEGTFSPERINTIAERFDLDVDHTLENIYVYQPLNVDDLEELVKQRLVSFVEKGVKLIVVDSIIALYRAEFKGVEYLARRQQRINYLLDWLKRIGRIYNTYNVITNQVVQQIGGFLAIKIPAGGNIIAHASTHRFLLKKAGDKWLIEVLDSPHIAKGLKAFFKITDKGVEPV
ncbi:MAG TPA: DNA repair and recombination protein RadA [Thermoproteales archaeon]|nr:DNA repair and recombination protein RadA [Thermoproteales archaeon]